MSGLGTARVPGTTLVYLCQLLLLLLWPEPYQIFREAIKCALIYTQKSQAMQVISFRSFCAAGKIV